MSSTLLPPNATEQERHIEAATARLADVPVPIRDVWNPDTCPVELLPWLAWAFNVDRWDANWTEQQKRQVIKNAVYIHRHRGTLGAVKRALQSLGYEAEITEWFQESPPGSPYTFWIDVSITDKGIDEALYSELERVIQDAKNVRSHLAGMLLKGTVRATARLGSSLASGVDTAVYPLQITEIEQAGPLRVLAAEYTADTVTVHYQ